MLNLDSILQLVGNLNQFQHWRLTGLSANVPTLEQLPQLALEGPLRTLEVKPLRID